MDFAAGVYLSEAHPIAPPPHTRHSIIVYRTVFLFAQGRGGGGGRVEPERRGEGQQGRVQIT